MEPTDPNKDPFDRPEPQVVKPEDMFNPSISVGPPAPNSTPPAGGQQAPGSSGASGMPGINSDPGLKKRILVVIGGVVVLFVIAVVVIVILSSGGKKNPSNQTGQNNQANGILNPPSALDIQNANNSITSDISSLNDDNDFPANNLTDNNLHL